jgi:hypothetical protein
MACASAGPASTAATAAAIMIFTGAIAKSPVRHLPPRQDDNLSLWRICGKAVPGNKTENRAASRVG